jgi:hypothetical protein
VTRRRDPFGVDHVTLTTEALEAAPQWNITPVADRLHDDAKRTLDSLGTLHAVRFVAGDALVVVAGTRDAVYLVDRRGRPLRALGSRGRGAGQYLEVALLETASPALVAVFDAPLRRLTFFDADGAASATVLPKQDGGPILPWRVLSDGSLFARGVRETIAALEPRGIVRDSEAVMRVSPSGTVLESFGTWAATDFELELQPDGSVTVREVPTPRRLLIASNDSLLIMSPGGPWEVLIHDRMGRRLRTVRADERPRDRDERWPALDALLLDDRARLWMRETPAAEESSPPPWIVLSLEGRPLARVSFPLAFTPHAVRGDEVAGVWRQANGRELPRVMRVTP